MSFLELQNITKIYPNGTKAVNETSLNIDNGEFVATNSPLSIFKEVSFTAFVPLG